MPRRACPYCYNAIDRDQLWFQCAGRGSPGHSGCERVEDPERLRLTGFAEPIRPAFPPPRTSLLRVRQARCPNCYGMTGIRTCPRCHTPLPANFGDSNSPLIAMVGAKGTGKTVYMTVLAHELRSNLRRQFDADVRMTGDGQAGFRSPLQWLENNVERMYNNRELFPQTARASGGLREPLVFEWRRAVRRVPNLSPTYLTSFLSFYDTAGEDLTSQASAHDQIYLGAADALILLLDPFMLPEARAHLNLPPSAIRSTESTIEVVNRITDTLRVSKLVDPRKRIKIPVAVAFAKIDAFYDHLGNNHPLVRGPAREKEPVYDETLGRMTHEYVRGLLHDWKADDIDKHLELNYARFRYFAVSALGAPPDYDNAIVDAAGVTPHRVDEPLVWLLSQFGIVKRREYRREYR